MPATAMMSGAGDTAPAPSFDQVERRLRHKLVYVVVVAVLDARADASGPRRPQAVADPALADGCHPRCRPVRGIACVEGVREVGVLNLDRVATGGYPREKIPVPANGGEGRVVLDPAQHVRYTGGVHKHPLMGRASGCDQHRRGHLFMTPVFSHMLVEMSTKSR